MVLVDTSIWVAHLRKGQPRLQALLHDGQVLCHPLIIGELACGRIHNREEVLSLLQALPAAHVVAHEEVLRFIEMHRLMGAGLGYIDMHLLASAMLSFAPLWTADLRLTEAATKLHLMYR